MAWGWDLPEDASRAAKALARIEPVRVVKFQEEPPRFQMVTKHGPGTNREALLGTAAGPM